MSDSNLTPQPASTPDAAPKQAVPEVQPMEKAKSYTERFMEMEQKVGQLIYVSNFQSRTLTSLMAKLTEINQELERLTLVKKSVNAMIQLSEKGDKISMDAVAQKVSDIETERTKEMLKNDLEKGLIVPATEITNEFSLIEFSSPVVEYGVATVNAFDEADSKLLMGKKAGETAGNINVLGVYEQVAPKEEQNEQKEQQTTN